MATPRDLDPKFRDEKKTPAEVEQKSEKKVVSPDDFATPVEPNAQRVSDVNRSDAAEENADDKPQIQHREMIRNPDGSVSEKMHGPMPVEDWPAYEKEHGF